MKSSTPEDIRERLQEVLDPELFLSIVDLGLVYNIHIEESESTEKNLTQTAGTLRTAVILMTLTTIGCPLFDTIQNDIKKAVLVLPDIDDIRVELTFDPPWEYSMMSESARAELGVEI